MKIRKTKTAKRDSRGRIRQRPGMLQNGQQARIQIADSETSDAEAARRLATIQALYQKQCERFRLDHWNHWCLQVAKEIGAGMPITDAFLMTMFNEATMASTAVLLREWGIPIQIKSSQQFKEGMAIHREQIETMVADLVQQKMSELTDIRGPVVKEVRLPDAMSMGETATLFDALDAFAIHLKETGDRNEKGELKTKRRKTIKDVDTLKVQFADHNMPLWKLQLAEWEKLVAIWRNRPLTHKKVRCKVSWSEQQIKLLYRFGRWLHTSRFDWQKPDGFDDVNRKPVKLPQDDNGNVWQTITKETYSPEELALIIENAKPFHRMIIAACVNCAFGQGEIGQWKTERMVFNERHKHEDNISFKSSDNDSWIVGPRPKTGCYGEHLLWPEVANAIQPYIDGRPVLWMTRNDTPIYNPNSLQPSSQIDNWWTGHIERLQKKHPNLEALPFGSLRDVLPNILTRDCTGSAGR